MKSRHSQIRSSIQIVQPDPAWFAVPQGYQKMDPRQMQGQGQGQGQGRGPAQ